MPQIFRKSFTACEQFAALPPTPRRKSRPPRARSSARSVAVRSMASRSKRPRISAASARCCLTNSVIPVLCHPERSEGPGGTGGAQTLPPRFLATLGMTSRLHSHHDPTVVSRKLLIATVATAVFVVVELIAGVAANSLALIGDAFHNFTDTLALLLALVA